MTDPTPTRAEDARVPDHCGWAARGHWSRAYKALLEDHQALRERAEAAEKAEAAAWKDAIELAAKVADAQAWAHGGVHFNGPEQNSARIAQAIRALRRAAPTEDR